MRIVVSCTLCIVCCLSPAFSDVTYWLHSSVPPDVATSVEQAVAIYNRHGSFNKHLVVYYDPGVPTAQANYDGVITFGGSRNTRVALHEIGHTVGIGTTWQYGNLMVQGVWQGSYGRNLAIEMASPYADGIHGDGVHIWPWGLNYDSEDSFWDRIKHVRIMAAMRCDMGIMAYSKEAEHQIVPAGGMATFSVQSPVATSYRWYKNGTALYDGNGITGTTTPTLQIAKVSSADEGSYYCAATGAGETLNSRSRKLMVEQTVGSWPFDGDAVDITGSNEVTVSGSPAYVTGRIGQALDLDGYNDYVTLPSGIADCKDMTVAAWVNWDGGNNWQRVFDFGNGTDYYMFLTPSDGGAMRFAIKYGWGTGEQRVDAPVLPIGQWIHLAVTLKGNTAKLYVNGQPVSSNTNCTIDPIDFSPAANYVGKSQFSADPLFNGQIDDFRVYNYALSDSDVSALSLPMLFAYDSFVNEAGVESADYVGSSLADYVDFSGDFQTLTFSKHQGPEWLTVTPDGTLSGVPGDADVGPNEFVVNVENHLGASDTAQMTIEVANIFSGLLGFEDLEGLAVQWLALDCADFPACNGADLDGDSAVTFSDFSILQDHWLKDPSLQLHLRLDEDNGLTAVDDGLYYRDGELVNGPNWSAGIFGGGLSFDGMDDHVIIPDYNGVAGTEARTCSAWVKTDTLAEQAIVQWGSDADGQLWLLYLLADGKLAFNGYGGSVKSSVSIADGQWHHVAAVLEPGEASSSQVKLYVDGQLDAVPFASLIELNTSADQPVHIGVLNRPIYGGKMFYFQGQIDDVRIYDRALTAETVQVLAWKKKDVN